MATAHAAYPGLGSARISPLTLIGLAVGTALSISAARAIRRWAAARAHRS